MVFGVIYVQFSTFLFSRIFWFSERSYFWSHFSTRCADFQSEFSTPHPGPKAILGHCFVGTCVLAGGDAFPSVRGVVSYSVVGNLGQKRHKFLNFSEKVCQIRGGI